MKGIHKQEQKAPGGGEDLKSEDGKSSTAGNNTTKPSLKDRIKAKLHKE